MIGRLCLSSSCGSESYAHTFQVPAFVQAWTPVLQSNLRTDLGQPRFETAPHICYILHGLYVVLMGKEENQDGSYHVDHQAKIDAGTSCD